MKDLLAYDIRNNKWEVLKVINEDEIQARRNHAAVVVKDKYILISGGVNSDDHTIGDICWLNVETLKWTCVRLENCDFSDHSMISVQN